jgi:hypothetical protein
LLVGTLPRRRPTWRMTTRRTTRNLNMLSRKDDITNRPVRKGEASEFMKNMS